MTDANDYDDEDREDKTVDEDEANAAEKGGNDESSGVSDLDLAEAETLTVTAKQHIREQLEDEVARFLAQGGQITQVPPDESAN
ncbi:hypothetical protein F4V57_01865 [Acinetobacter qingfengensis]|uniref:Transcriptional regulator SutA RNAP-binding domain-containing protein n=1 Tax=Acinetobacter qingfengensis TaxID=1262585 RepID=A0A1E7R8T5_9GAMM|nr:hypothetical protein [Acinetobacter qingfengensis]KAA8735562.1 hypothetical protein F4V57_01865 [Acinetobacter qingfengensis]OEY95790.1 hypothetical protein BJI46_02375 [Acinetobacter qingfengensis]